VLCPAHLHAGRAADARPPHAAPPSPLQVLSYKPSKMAGGAMSMGGDHAMPMAGGHAMGGAMSMAGGASAPKTAPAPGARRLLSSGPVAGRALLQRSGGDAGDGVYLNLASQNAHDAVLAAVGGRAPRARAPRRAPHALAPAARRRGCGWRGRCPATPASALRAACAGCAPLSPARQNPQPPSPALLGTPETRR
jgi:hypothetical protein